MISARTIACAQPFAHERCVAHTPERVRTRDPGHRFEQARLALPVRTVNDREPGIELEIDALEAAKVVEPEMTDTRGGAGRGLREHLGQDVRTGMRRYRKSPLSAACSVAGFSGSIVSSTTSSVSTASTPSCRNSGLNATVSSVPSNFASTDS